MTHKVKLVTPHAGVIIWNYTDRVNATGGDNVHDIQEVIIGTSTLMSIGTSKNKSTPAGSFEFMLAPTHNWIARITPGSWCVILMSQNKPIPQISSDNPGSADKDLLKMLGRIDSVRVAIEVDQESGARRTYYVVTGRDWGSVFDTKLYIDPVARNNALDSIAPIGHSYRIGFDQLYTSATDGKSKGLPTSTNIVDAIIKIWGTPISDVSSAVGGAQSSSANPQQLDKNPIFSSEAQFKLPAKVAQYLGLGYGTLGNQSSVNFASIIDRRDGILTSYDTYSGDNQESIGIPAVDSLYKMNTFWQVLTDNSNPAINELVTDIRWVDNLVNLTLYKRVKPFINRAKFEGYDKPQVQKNISLFAYIRTIKIPIEDVVNINAGTNWRDKVNFVEIQPSQQLFAGNQNVYVKLQSQAIDRPAYERDGFKPLMQSVYYMPDNGSNFDPIAATQWKYLLREWFFNTHLMLNGSITIIGQNKYIQVGDNIQIDASVLGPNSFNSLQEGNAAYLTAHVESIQHKFSVEPNTGARSFATSIQFVRGVLTKQDGTIFGGAGIGLASLSGAAVGATDPLDGALDRTAGDLTPQQEKNNSVLGTSTGTDPNQEKLRGN